MTKKAVWVFLFIGFVSLALIPASQALPISEGDLSKIRIKMDIQPYMPCIKDYVRIQGDMIFMNDSYVLESYKFKVEDSTLFLDFNVQRGDFWQGNDVVKIDPFKFDIGNLKEGVYTIIARANEMKIYDTMLKVTLDPQTPPVPPEPRYDPKAFPFYNPQIGVDPAYPILTDDVILYVKGFLPDASYTITDSTETVDGSLITLDFDIASSGQPADQVLVPVKKEYPLGKLQEGFHTVILNVNGQIIQKFAFDVTVERQTPPDIMIPNPSTALLYRPSIKVNPEFPADVDDVTVTVHGYLRNPYCIVTSSKSNIAGNQVMLEVNIEARGTGADELTDMSIEFPLGKLAAENYYILLLVNGQPTEKKFFQVGGGSMPNPEPNPNPFGAGIAINPSNPAVDEEVEVLIKGEFPSTGYQFTDVVTEIVDKNDLASWSGAKSVYIKAKAAPPEIGAAVMVPFSETLAKIKLQAGFYSIYVTINDKQLYPVLSCWVGNKDTSTGDSSTGNTGMAGVINYRVEDSCGTPPSLLNIDDKRNAVSFNGAQEGNAVTNNTVPASLWNDLQNALNEADFMNLPPEIKPGNVAGKFVRHVITYNSKTVAVYDGAEISKPLAKALDILNQLVNSNAVPSAVSGWEAY